MEWWMWLAAGLVLVAAELLTPGGFVLLFFGFGALTVGALTLIGSVSGAAMQFLLFSVLSVGSLALLRRRIQSRLQTPQSAMVDSLIGDLARPLERMAPGVVGRVEVRGSTWSARNTSNITLDPGQRARVVAVDQIMLSVVPE
jgi:membrane protein implicated in regulation of membrane protease activity